MSAPFRQLLAELDPVAAGQAMHDFCRQAFPLRRSLTGDGVRQTLALLAERIPLVVHEVPSGTAVLDWTVPKEWRVREAWLADPSGRRVIDVAESGLHLLGYSTPVAARMRLSELQPHLYSLPEKPDWTPYRTSYYTERWGFCLPHRVLEELPEEGEYEVRIDSELFDGSLTYGECVLPGEEPREVLLSTHVCHPQLANDNLSGIAVSTFLAAALAHSERRYTYRFLFLPGTIGAITWLAKNQGAVGQIEHGLVVANLGDNGGFHYKRSRRGDAEIDRLFAHLSRGSDPPVALEDFVPFGYDERQYCSPGFDLPVGCLSRTPWGRYPEYHTSADDLDLIRPAALAGSLRLMLEVVAHLEENRRYRNLSPKGEPQLGRRGLYRAIGGGEDDREQELAMLWMLSLSDGGHDLLAIAERSGLPLDRLDDAAQALLDAGLLAFAG